jgi:hypothetical protein
METGSKSEQGQERKRNAKKTAPRAVVLNHFKAATPFNSKFLFATHNIFKQNRKTK